MIRRLLLAAGVAAFVAATSPSAEAQARFGANLSWGDDTDWGLGARLGLGLRSLSESTPVEGYFTFDYFFPDGFDYWEVSANAVYNIPTTSSVRPFAGAGLGYGNATSGSPGSTGFARDSDLFLRLSGGIRFAMIGNVQPFAEGALGLGGGSQLVLSAGVLFGRP